MGRRVKPKVGDVFEVRLRDGRLAYLQMISESAIGNVARVLSGRHESPARDIGSLVDEPHEYLMYAFLGSLERAAFAANMGNWHVPSGVWWGLKPSTRYDRARRSGE